MKHTIRYIILLVALMLMGAGEMWAIERGNIIINTVKPNAEAGTVRLPDGDGWLSGRTVTIVVTPASGYKIKKSLIVVEKMIDPSSSRRAPGIGQFTLNGPDGWQTGEVTYTFDIPEEYDGAFVTATFAPSTANVITSLSEITDLTETAFYELASDIEASSLSASLGDFKGTLDGGFHKIYGLSKPLFSSTSGNAVIRNITFEDVNIGVSGDAGAITANAGGNTRIYNCGILPTTVERDDDGNITGFSGSTVSGTGNVGGLVGLLNGTARVINCYSYATVSGGSMMGGIVGRNNQASTMSSIKTIVVNCMFYGEISGGGPGSAYPVYGGNVINNEGDNAINNYNYYRGDATFDDNYSAIAHYNRSWPAEERNLTRFEYYRSILNSNRRLCTWWVNGTNGTTPTDDDVKSTGIAKWVLDPSIAPYPILKEWGKYPSIINPDPDRTWRPKATDADGIVEDARWVNRSNAKDYEGKKLGTIKITVKTGSYPGTLTGLTEKSRDLNQVVVTDMDTLNCDFGYAKVQLPYYNEVFGDPSSNNHLTRYYGNYTNKVVTAWKITSVTTDGTVTDYHSFVANWESGYNYADRHSTAKDIYDSNGNRAFAQGGYYYVPEGVTAIEIEAYWGTAFYLHGKGHALDRVDVTKSKNYGRAFTPAGTLSTTMPYNSISIYDDFNTMMTAVKTNKTCNVYDQAVVLVGNYPMNAQNDIDLGNSGKGGFTIMSADFDMDNEPDFCFPLQWRSNYDRRPIMPVRFDFLPIPELGLTMRHNTYAYAIGIMVPQGHFEITETSFMHTTQFEYMSVSVNINHQQPLIFNGGEFEQIVAHGNTNKPEIAFTRNIIMGGHVWMKRFTPGSHAGNNNVRARHCAVSVMGGEFPEFYLSGLYRTDVTTNNAYNDNPHCYTNGGRFGIMAGAGMEAVRNSVYFEIDHSVIDEFYGGGINANNPVAGSINVTINNSLILEKYCGGPKVGTSQTVTTNAKGTVFNQYYGGGNGGTNLYREQIKDETPDDMPSESTWSGNTYGWSSFTPISGQNATATYDASKGYHAEFEFEVFNQSNGIDKSAVARSYRHWAQFGVTSTGNVTNTLSDCTFKHNFYGGGNLANVSGDVTSTLTDCTVMGSVFGAGFSASIPSFPVHDKTKVSFPYRDASGVCHNGSVGYLKDGNDIRQYTWCYKNPTTNVVSPAGVVIPDGVDTSKPAFQYDGKWYCYTTVSLEDLGTVTGNATLNIEGSTEVGGSVYGGGEESAVNGNTTVSIAGGMIGEEGQGRASNGSVFGGGNLGVVEHDTNVSISGGSVHYSVYGGGCEADVLGNTNVTMTGGYVFNGIFGGGLSGSVGTFTRSTAEADVTVFGSHPAHDGCIGMPMSCEGGTGKCTVSVTGGQIGPIEVATQGMTRPASEGGPVPEGWVWGGGCGLIEDPATHPDTHFKTYVGSTDVTIGGTAFILESIIGGGEFGRVLDNTHVTIEGNCQIGVGAGQTEGGKPKPYTNEQFVDPSETAVTTSLAPCSTFPYGKVVDGKTVYDTYDPYYDKYYGTATDIPDEFAHGSTANASDGKTWIGCVFGGGSGYYPYEKEDGTGYGWVRSAGWVGGNTLVEIKGGHILSNVYGANEYTDVKGKSTVKMSGGTIGVPRTKEQIEANPMIGHLFGGGKGDPRTYFNTSTNVGNVEVEVTGGIIYGSVYGGGEDGHVTDNVKMTIGKETTVDEKTTKSGPVIGCINTSGDNGNVFGGGQGASTALTAGVVGGNVTLDILGGSILGSVYGGGQIASVGTYFANAGDSNYGKMQDGNDHGCITVNLTGGTIEQNVYGGCMGTNADADAGVTEEFAAKLGLSKNVTVNLNGTAVDNVVANDKKGCAVVGSIFGCNNVNSSPEGTVKVNIYGTQHKGKSQIANTAATGTEGQDGYKAAVEDAKTKGEYDVKAVYGGGNMAAYSPKNLDTGTTEVVINGCERTSIQQVYGGGNAASTPATSLTINGTFEIEEVFGGGNGKDDVVKDGVTKPNPGANVGFYDYSTVESTYDTKAKRQQTVFTDSYVYGTGKASVNIYGGTIHRVFGGSNTKGNVRQTAVTMLEDAESCAFCVDEAYGGGKSAPMDAEAKLLMSCIPGLNAAYGGAEAADIQGDVTLNITNGTFDRVFGGNNKSGTINGSITVNISEIGCKPIIIGELYGGGNQAPYSVFGYKNMGTIEEPDYTIRTSLSDGSAVSTPETPYSSSQLFADPLVNVKSFTSIGTIYGGGYGETAVMVGSPVVNINEVVGTPNTYPTTGDFNTTGFKGKTKTIDGHEVVIPAHTKNKIGAINNVFGGGNAAPVKGDTYVNIGTEEEVYEVAVPAPTSENFAEGTYFVLDGEGTIDKPYEYIPAGTTFDEDITYYEKKTVVGVDIRGNVYGGGNNAEVTGNTHVQIGKKNE
ncbi:MAG: hypothetical protein IJV17_00285 [Prevotella sp.]|nr:hypothetical protein [Prevotella sp.]